jgi:hypothetical protein
MMSEGPTPRRRSSSEARNRQGRVTVRYGAGELGLSLGTTDAWIFRYTKREKALVEAADIFTDAPTDIDLAFLTRDLVQCTLPHRNPGDVPVWDAQKW